MLVPMSITMLMPVTLIAQPMMIITVMMIRMMQTTITIALGIVYLDGIFFRRFIKGGGGHNAMCIQCLDEILTRRRR